jgi:O-antigen ligase
MSVGFGLCAAATLALWLARRRPWPAPRPLLWPALGWGLALLLAAWFAEDRAGSLPRVAKGGLLVAVWLAAFHARTPEAGRRAVGVLLLSAGAAVIFGLTLWVGRGAALPERARGLVGHYMTFAGQLLLWISLAAGVALAGPRSWRPWTVAVALAGGAALAATFTRSAWIGSALSLGVMLALWRPRGLGVLAAALALAVLAAPPGYRDRLASAFDPGHASNLERRHMWEAGLRMFRDRPITGLGLQDLHPAYERYRPPEAVEGAGHLHNVYVQIAASMGIVGLAAFAWLFTTLFRAAASGPRRPGEPPGVGRGVRLGLAGGLAGFLAAGLFEWNFGDEELLHALFVLVGIAWSARRWGEGPTPGIARR